MSTTENLLDSSWDSSWDSSRDSSWDCIINTQEVYNIVDSLNCCYTPERKDVLNAFKYVSPRDVKVVIIGQDPYPTKGYADGLCFSSRMGKVPASLKKIYECILDDPDFDSCDLTSWALQGVLMINSSLTTVVGESNAHVSLWRNWFKSTITNLCSITQRKLVFLLWGSEARKIASVAKEHIVLEWTHPSPLADNKLPIDEKFINCDHFEKTSHLINWNLLDPVYAFSDGAAKKNGKPGARASYASLLIGNIFRNTRIYGEVKAFEYTSVDTTNNILAAPTNNRGELLGLINCLNACVKCHIVGPIYIISDSKIYIDLLNTGYKKHIQKGTESGLANYDLLKIAWSLLISIKGTVTIFHHPSHRSEPINETEIAKLYFTGNKEADLMATEALSSIEFYDKKIINGFSCL